MFELIFDKLTASQLVLLFAFIVFPGLVSMHVYRLIFPTKRIEWQTAIFEASFWGSINLLVALSLIRLVQYFGTSVELLFVIPFCTAVLLPIVWVRAATKTPIKKYCLNPAPVAWDHYFAKKQPCLVLVHLKNGSLIGGYYGANSYASSYPEKRSIYFEKLVHIDIDGNFKAWVENSNGAILDSDIYDYLEFFTVSI
jgi:hypothetical protein